MRMSYIPGLVHEVHEILVLGRLAFKLQACPLFYMFYSTKNSALRVGEFIYGVRCQLLKIRPIKGDSDTIHYLICQL